MASSNPRTLATESDVVNLPCRSLWDPLESFFAQRGYRLFIYQDQEYDVPAIRDEVRSPDPYHHFIGERKSSRFYCTVSRLATVPFVLNLADV